MKKISWKSINSWIMFGLLLAPGLYLFGGYIGQLAGSHGEFMYAEPAIEGGVDYSVEYNGTTYQRVMYTPNSRITFSGDIDPDCFVGCWSWENDRVNACYNTAFYSLNNVNLLEEPSSIGLLWLDTGELDDIWYGPTKCFSFWLITNAGTFYYCEVFGQHEILWAFDEQSGEEINYYPNGNHIKLSIEQYYEMYFSYTTFHDMWGVDLEWTHTRNIPETQPYIQEAPAIEQTAQGNTEFQQGQFFSRNNFLKKWGDSVVSQEETWGFAPFKALVQYLDENMLHFASNGVQYGLMAYGYMYYALHIVLLDLVFYITSFLPRILKKLAERLEGGLD